MMEMIKKIYRLGRKMIYIGCTIATIFLAGVAVKKYFEERQYLMWIYSNAVEEVLEHCRGYNIEVAGYKKEYIQWQIMEYHDFGEGELRYSKYAVKVPVEYDTTFGHQALDITIVVYHYTPWNLESVGATPNPEIQDHIYVEDMYADLRKLFE